MWLEGRMQAIDFPTPPDKLRTRTAREHQKQVNQPNQRQL